MSNVKDMAHSSYWPRPLLYIPEVPVDNDDCDEDGDRVHYECE